MKKTKITAAGLSMIFIAMTLTSCQVNWHGQNYRVHWWVLVVPVIIFSLSVLIASGRYIASKQYVCPQCKQSFYPKWWKAAFSMHMNDERVFKCPHCGRKGFCKEKNEWM